MQKLSVIIGVYNEGFQLRDCLDGIKDIADEIIIMDSLSTDNTIEVCKEYTDKIHSQAYLRYAKTRNQLIDLAKNEWIFSIDADERFSAELRDEIVSVLKDGDAKSAYQIHFSHVCFGRRMKTWNKEDYHIRLFRKSKTRYEDREVHAKIIVDGDLGTLANDITHIPYRNVAAYIEKARRYTNWDADQLTKESKKKTLWGLIKLFIRPFYYFFRSLIRDKMFLDGWQGLLIAYFAAIYPSVVEFKYYFGLRGKSNG